MTSAAIKETPPTGAGADWTIDQDWNSYSPSEHKTWITLFERQSALLPDRACDPFLRGLEALDLHRAGIPDFERINRDLERLTGWRIVAVPGLVPDPIFFDHLANRRFPAGRFIRRPDELDYLEEPDIFHDVFGHVPMLTDPIFADYMQAYGRGGLRAMSLGRLKNLARLYWYTVEFGLLRTASGLRVYGAGILSSAAESRFALESPSPHRLDFSLDRVMRTPYRIDDFQQTYFVVPSLSVLLDATLQDFSDVYARVESASELGVDEIDASDSVVSRGDQAYALGGGRSGGGQ